MRNVTFLCSGNGGNLKFLFLLNRNLQTSSINLSVIADRECGATLFARKNKINCRIINIAQNQQSELAGSIADLESELIFTTFHRIISTEVLKFYSNKMINLHYSLLPKYSGVIGMEGVRLGIRNRDPFLGVTTHRLTSVIDGGPVITQSFFQNPLEFDSAANISFRVGCLQIWASIQQLEEGNQKLSNISENIFEDILIHHSRQLPLLPKFVDTTFWDEIASL
jgi:phosphoribosylglycinamide formyltransferase-1